MKKNYNILNKFLSFIGINKFYVRNSDSSKDDGFSNAINLLESFGHLPDLVFVIDKTMKIVWANDELLKQFPDAIGRFCPEMCNSSDILHLGCYCKKAIETGEVTKIKIYKPDNVGIYQNNFWEGMGIPLKNESGMIVGSLGVLKDITDTMLARELEFLTGLGKTGFETIKNSNSIDNNSESFFENIISGISVGIAVFDNFRRIKFWNVFMENMTGLKSDVINNKLFEEVFSITDIPEIQEAINKTLHGETYFIQDAGLTFNATQKTIWITGNVTPKYSKTGTIIGSILTIRYYRDYVIPESLLQETSETLNALIISSPAAIMILDKDAKVKIWNPAAEKMFGWLEEEVIGKINPIINSETAEEFSNLFEKIMHGNTITNSELIRYKKDGARVNVSLSASPLRDSTGEIRGIVGILTDITDTKISEEALKESEVRYRSFVQNFQGIAYRLLPDGGLVFINGAVESITGYAEQEFLSGKLKWRDIVHPDDMYKLIEYDSKIGVIPGFELDLEYRIIKKDKSIRWIHEYLQNITDHHSKIINIQGTFQDITQRKEAEEELKRSREHLRNLALHLESTREEEKKHIAFEIHDELGHALTALKLELSWLIKKRHIREEVLFERVKKMSDLIDSTIRKVRSISSDLRPSVLDHFGLVAAIEWQAAEFQKRSAVRCKLNIAQTDFKLDENRSIAVFRILQEVLTNVARHAQATRVDIHFEKIDGNIILRVSDNGRGIKQEQINNRKSFGLIGMFERANAFGGKVSISGVIGIGTTVTVQIPLSN